MILIIAHFSWLYAFQNGIHVSLQGAAERNILEEVEQGVIATPPQQVAQETTPPPQETTPPSQQQQTTADDDDVSACIV